MFWIVLCLTLFLRKSGFSACFFGFQSLSGGKLARRRNTSDFWDVFYVLIYWHKFFVFLGGFDELWGECSWGESRGFWVCGTFKAGSEISSDFALWFCIVILHCAFALWFCIVVLYCGFALWFCIVILHCGFALWFCIVVLHCDFALWFCIGPHSVAWCRASRGMVSCCIWRSIRQRA